MSGHFGQLREFLQTPPEDQRWGQLCMLLEDFKGHELLELALPYVEDHLKRWPHLERRVPMIWLERAIQCKEEPRLRLCRTLATHKDLTLAQTRALAACEDLDALERVKLTNSRTKEDAMQALAQASWWHHIKDLELGYLQHADTLFAHMSLNPEIESMRVLSRSAHVASAYLHKLISQAPLFKLTKLELGCLDEHARSSHQQLMHTCPQLTDLTLIYGRATDAPSDLITQLPQTLKTLKLYLYEEVSSIHQEQDPRLNFWRPWIQEAEQRDVKVRMEVVSWF